MKNLALALLVTISSHAFAKEIVFRPVEPLKSGESFRNEWDSTGQFCYKVDAKTECAKIVQQGEVKIREKGRYSLEAADKAFIDQLTYQARKVSENYNKLYIRYLALEGGERFVVHMHFNSGPGSETLFVFGTVANVRGFQIASVDSFSYSPNDLSGRMIQGFLNNGGYAANMAKETIRQIGERLIVAEEISTMLLNGGNSPATILQMHQK